MRDGPLEADLVTLCLLVEVHPDAGDGHGVRGRRFAHVRHGDQVLLRVQQVVQPQHRQEVLQLGKVRVYMFFIKKNPYKRPGKVSRQHKFGGKLYTGM